MDKRDWLSLPLDTLQKVASRLELPDVLGARVVCREWRRHLATCVSTAKIAAPPIQRMSEQRLRDMYFVCPTLESVTLTLSSRTSQEIFEGIVNHLAWFSRLDTLCVQFLVPNRSVFGVGPRELGVLAKLKQLKELRLAVRRAPRAESLSLLAELGGLQTLRVVPSCTVTSNQYNDIKLDREHIEAISSIPALRDLECWIVEGKEVVGRQDSQETPRGALGASLGTLTNLASLHLHGCLPAAASAALTDLPQLRFLTCTVAVANVSSFLADLSSAQHLADMNLTVTGAGADLDLMSFVKSCMHHTWLHGLSLQGLTTTEALVANLACISILTQLTSLSLSLRQRRHLVAGQGLLPQGPDLFPMHIMDQGPLPQGPHPFHIPIMGMAALLNGAQDLPFLLDADDDLHAPLELDLRVLCRLQQLRTLELQVEQSLVDDDDEPPLNNPIGGRVRNVHVPVDEALLALLSVSMPSLSRLSLKGVALAHSALFGGLRHLRGLTSLELGTSIACELNPQCKSRGATAPWGARARATRPSSVLACLPEGLHELSLRDISTSLAMPPQSLPHLYQLKLSRCALGSGSLPALVASAPRLSGLRCLGLALEAPDCPTILTALRGLTSLAVCSCSVRPTWRSLLPQLTTLPNLQVVEWCCTEGNADELAPLARCPQLHAVSSPHSAPCKGVKEVVDAFRVALYCDLDKGH